MLRVRGASAVADQKHLMPGTERADDRECNLTRHREQRGILRRALKRSERLLKMDRDLVVAQDAPLSP